MRTLHEPAEQAGLNSYTIGEKLRDKPEELPSRIEEIIAKGAGRSALVLFLDQMEELFTIHAREYAADFITALTAAARKKVLWIVATIRNDHLQHCYRHEELLQVLRGPGHYPLGQVDPSATEDIIKKPAQCAGLEITDRLARRIARESGSESGSLPLLAFVLQRLFAQRDGQALSEKVYKNIGGVAGAVAYHVNTIEQELRQEIGAAVKDLLPRLFQKLLVVDSEGLPTRRWARLSDFADDLVPLVDRLIKARLFSTEGKGKDSTVSVAHEKLFEAWPALASWIAENKDDLRLLRQVRLAAAEWDEQGRAPHFLWPHERLVYIGEMVERMSPKLSVLEHEFVRPESERLLEKINQTSTTHQQRTKLGDRLSEIGDPRPGVGLREDDLPDIVWCKVPSGKVLLERIKRKFSVGNNLHISKYPVTWVQFRAFLEAKDGYRNERWWKDLAKRSSEPDKQYRKLENHPVENVSWYDAVAFCLWLTERMGIEIKLPTEWEWQLAATDGNPENEYPWGAVWDSSYANTNESRLSRSTAVGMYPHGASPVGALDMSGNVWEWCLNEHDNPRQVEVSGEAIRSLRGGSWNDLQCGSRAAFRNDFPFDRHYYLGFRLLCSSPHLLNR
jgi:hypothetical protein